MTQRYYLTNIDPSPGLEDHVRQANMISGLAVFIQERPMPSKAGGYGYSYSSAERSGLWALWSAQPVLNQDVSRYFAVLGKIRGRTYTYPLRLLRH